MDLYMSDRRLARRRTLAIRLRFRVLKSDLPEQRAESLDLSERGVYFATNLPLREGTPVELLLQMPEEITGKPAIDWRCTGHVVRVQPMGSSRDVLGVGVRFDCYEVLPRAENWCPTSSRPDPEHAP